jgi:hypothetical protein
LIGTLGQIAKEIRDKLAGVGDPIVVELEGGLSDSAVQSDVTGITGADQVTNIVSLTQAEYDAIVTPDESTLYIIKE